MLLLLPHQIEWINRLAADGLSLRQISAATGLARGTVRKVLPTRRRKPEIARQDAALAGTLYDVEEPFFTGPPARCPQCGAHCYMPCLRCHLHALRRQAEPTAGRPDHPLPPLGA